MYIDLCDILQVVESSKEDQRQARVELGFLEDERDNVVKKNQVLQEKVKQLEVRLAETQTEEEDEESRNLLHKDTVAP